MKFESYSQTYNDLSKLSLKIWFACSTITKTSLDFYILILTYKNFYYELCNNNINILIIKGVIFIYHDFHFFI